MSRSISYFLSSYSENIQNQKGREKSLRECLTQFQIIVNSTEFENYGHRLPLFKYIVKQYEKKCGTKIETNKHEECKRTSLTEEEPYYKDLKLRKIETREHKYLKNLNINEDILDIVKNEIKLPNTQCAGCCEVFIKDFEIINNNSEFPLIIGLNEAESSYMNLERYICALNNAGGGFIIVGGERKGNGVWVSGINFRNNNELQ